MESTRGKNMSGKRSWLKRARAGKVMEAVMVRCMTPL